MTATRSEIADALRGRLLRGLHAGALRAGDRLPSARELRHEFGDVDHRIILDAYRLLETEGLVELRARGGIYVARQPGVGNVPLPSASWLTDVFAQSVAREIPLGELHHWLRRGIATLRLRCVAIQGTADQIAGLCRELHDDYGLVTLGMNARDLAAAREVPADLRHADLIVTTVGYESLLRPLAERHGKTLIVVDVRPDLIGGEWRLLLRRPVYVVMKDERFADILRDFFRDTPGADNIRAVVLGRDSLDAIPDDAAVYVTRSARTALGKTPVRGRLLPSARLFSSESARQLIRFIVEANLHALAAGNR